MPRDPRRVRGVVRYRFGVHATGYIIIGRGSAERRGARRTPSGMRSAAIHRPLYRRRQTGLSRTGLQRLLLALMRRPAR
jgi:hypothetical protein